MPPVRVLIVDDSSTVRRLLSAALSAHSEIEVAGTAANGLIGLSKVAQLEPDAVILDVEMPEMDGITALTHLRETHPRLPVIMFSMLTERGANVTFDALAAGASDYVLKPSSHQGETLDEVVRNVLVPKLLGLTRSRFGLALQEAMASANRLSNRPIELRRLDSKSLAPTIPVHGARPSSTGAAFAPALLSRKEPLVRLPLRPSVTALDPKLSLSPLRRSQPQQGARRPVQVIVIAASTGGPNALAAILPCLPAGLPVPVLVVQHMPPIFTRCLAERLALRCELRVIESQGGERLNPGTVYIAPGDRHLELQRELDGVQTLLSDGPREHSCRPAADLLFRSAVGAYGGAVMGVVLTGMGQDGARGARDIYEAGGRVLVQSGPTCVIWGMPKAVEEMGVADAVVPLDEMALAIVQRVGLGLLPIRLPGSAP